MSKIQTIGCLFIFLVILFSMDMIFGNELRETFGNSKLGSKIGIKPIIRTKQLNGNIDYPKKDYLVGNFPPSYIVNSDDQPLNFGFSFSK